MQKTTITAAFLSILILSSSVFAQFQPAETPDKTPQIFPLTDLKEGMKGVARTVFHGTKPEEFNVEILGVLPNWIGPKQDVIVGRLSGALAERTFVFAGMSGSPVYIDGKLVGAISYSFPFAKEPICGITPIEQMISAVERVPAQAAAPRQPVAILYADLLSNTLRTTVTAEYASRGPLVSGFAPDSRLTAVAGQTLVPIATPIMFSGISQAAMERFAPDLMRAGIMPVAATSGNTPIHRLKPVDNTTLGGGDSVVVHLSRGDVVIAAAGTVTLRDGEKIYAFGHPFFSLGTTALPMSESHVVTVVPNANNSFKLAVPDATVGAMTQDRATGIFGKLGESPRMLPVKIKLRTSRGRDTEINFDSAFDDLLTPLIVNAGIGSALSANERGLGDSTIEFEGQITIKGEEPIKINRRFSGGQSAIFAASAPAVPLSALLRAGFEGMEITGVNVNMKVVDGSKLAVIDRISVDRKQARSGETLQAQIVARSEDGRMFVQRVPITIPKGTAVGSLAITIGDGSAVQQNAAITQFIPRSAAELIATINRLKRPDRLYAILSRTSSGLIVGASEMPNLPPSVLATMNNDRTAGGSKAAVQTIVADIEIPGGEYIISGQQTLAIEVIR